MIAFRHAERSLADNDLDPSRQRLALAAILVNVAIAMLDASMVSAALPTIARSLSVSDAQAIWVVSAYQIAMVAIVLPVASLGEHIGLRRVTMAGLFLLVLASALCFFAPTLGWLIMARAVQGAGAGCILGLSLAMMRSIAGDARLGSAMGLNAFASGLSMAAGPLLAGILLSFASWHWQFVFTSVASLFAIAISLRHLLPTPRNTGRYNGAGALLCVVMLAATAFGLNALAHGDSSLLVAGTMMAAGLAFFALVKHQAVGDAAPLLAFDLLAQPSFALPAVVSFLGSATQSLLFVVLPFLLQRVLGFTQIEMALLIMVWPVLAALIAPAVGRLSDRVSAELLCCAGMIIVAAGLAALASSTAMGDMVQVGGCLLLCGIGFGLFQSPNMRALMSAGPIERSSRASGIMTVIYNLGQAVGAALVAAFFASLGTYGAEATLWVGVLACGLSATLSLLRWPRQAVSVRS
jgi:DHA2 family multidrug resistance protein-like MFS transporter